ncbi:hypothetical protein CK203_034710 [Vitis vinifera]|uniref:Reverse transcriptase RNase H-like domain-containing protein n=1 Tax=Vitis vinifera TaxID=29760 RepID=A0A438HWK4_VITVI|nr:hypothetical protein CK203_034710 [Vitis vinifera]
MHLWSDFWEIVGYMVSERGIEFDPDKIKSILDMPVSRIEKEINDFLVSPMSGRPLLLYLPVSDITLGCMRTQHDDSRKEQAIYYLSKRILEYEMRYVMIKRLCVALVWATRRSRHCMIEYSVCLISRLDPLRYLFDKPALTGRLMRWLVILSEFDIQYVSQKSIKRSIVANHLVSLSISEGKIVDDDFSNEEFVAMTSLSDRHPITNNIVEYEACILVVRRFDDLRYTHLPRAQNQFVDALATLASSVDIPTDVVIRPLLIESRGRHNQGSEGIEAVFMICGETLCRRSVDCMLLLCLNRASTDRVMREVHAGACGPHMGGHMLARKIMRTELHTLTSPWPFSVWGIDIIGKISLKSSSCHEFILVAIDYFTNTFPIGVLADSCPLNAP